MQPPISTREEKNHNSQIQALDIAEAAYDSFFLPKKSRRHEEMYYSISEFPPYHHAFGNFKKTAAVPRINKYRGHGVTLYASVHTSSILFWAL